MMTVAVTNCFSKGNDNFRGRGGGGVIHGVFPAVLADHWTRTKAHIGYISELEIVSFVRDM